jgi:phosphate-selective porin OprO/OprP
VTTVRAAVVALSVLGTTSLLQAQTPAPDRTAPTAQPASSTASPPAAATTASPTAEDDAEARPPFRLTPSPTLRIGSSLRVDFHYRTQWNVRAADIEDRDDDDDEASIVDFASHRIGVEGRVLDVVEFEIERDVIGNDPWRDVFVNVAPFRAAEVKAGQFRVPFSLDEQTGSASRDFVYRSLAARQLAPGRDVGVMLHGRVARRVGYQIGLFREDGRNARPGSDARVSGERTLAARLVVQPWRGRDGMLEDLQVGVAGTDSDVPLGQPALRAETVLGVVVDTPGTFVQGPRRRAGVELRWRPGPFSLKSEYMRVTTAREGQGLDDEDLSPLLAAGWYVSGTWALTGERKADGLTRPRRPLHAGGPGAIELAMRLEGVSFRSVATGAGASTSPRAAIVPAVTNRAATVGVNWYVNRYIKLQANLVRESILDASPLAIEPRRTSWSRLLQVQFVL